MNSCLDYGAPNLLNTKKKKKKKDQKTKFIVVEQPDIR